MKNLMCENDDVVQTDIQTIFFWYNIIRYNRI